MMRFDTETCTIGLSQALNHMVTGQTDLNWFKPEHLTNKKLLA